MALSNEAIEITGEQFERITTKRFEESYPRKKVYHLYTQPQTSSSVHKINLIAAQKFPKADCVARKRFCNWFCVTVFFHK
jgi:hypothetical protein